MNIAYMYLTADEIKREIIPFGINEKLSGESEIWANFECALSI